MGLFNVSELGIKDMVVEGELTIPQLRPGNPTVFLIDEHHTTPECIDQNIANAQSVMDKLGEALFGVESHAAYRPPGDDDDQLNEHPEFAEHFHRLGKIVRGVEQIEMFLEMTKDMECGYWPGAVRDHPINHLRSRYYLIALFRLRRLNNFVGPLILNCGRVHNDHIEQLIAAKVVHLFAGEEASYIRLRATAYPALVIP